MIRRLALLFLLVLAAPAAAQTFPPLSGRVVDQANIIPDDREAAMTHQLEQLQRATSRQLVVATIADLEGYEIEDYGYRLGRHWGIGQSEANNGVILLVAPNQRRVRIEVGYGLEGILTDALSSRIINEQIVPRFRENDYAGGVEVGAAALVSQLAAPPEAAEQRALEAEQAQGSMDAGGGEGGNEAWFVIVGILIFLGIPLLLAVVEVAGDRRHRARVSPWGRDYDRQDDGAFGWAVAAALADAFLRGGGGGGGGSSWSSGGSFGGGGGGGGFSGGGGSFGGGGASGSW